MKSWGAMMTSPSNGTDHVIDGDPEEGWTHALGSLTIFVVEEGAGEKQQVLMEEATGARSRRDKKVAILPNKFGAVVMRM
ncbi:hypothetical protein OPV22_033803 [Ensete ventricosum]|uniref:Uncharacterized protein n=1 Tax=Ensete ventricosum TaxID=4639 RepID=A0AAV8PQW9_ENSVE|nr:hypothetical protein OPV22_033803 [Ensete ventricosum]